MRSRSAEALGRLGKAAAKPDVVVRLSGCLLDRERQVRLAAARALGALGLDAATPEVVSRLRNWLEDPDEYIRGCAARALRQLMTAGARFFSGVKGINVVSVRLLAKTNPPWNIGVG